MTTALFFIGLLLELAGFLLASVNHVPALLRIVSPSYANAASAAMKLREGGSVVRSDKGFDFLARITMERLAAQNPAEAFANVSVLRFERTGVSGIGFGKRGVTERLPVTVQLSTGTTVEWNLVKIDEHVTSLRASHLFAWAVGLFGVGITFQIVGHFVGRHAQLPAG